jgi:hypothetical protein
MSIKHRTGRGGHQKRYKKEFLLHPGKNNRPCQYPILVNNKDA